MTISDPSCIFDPFHPDGMPTSAVGPASWGFASDKEPTVRQRPIVEVIGVDSPRASVSPPVAVASPKPEVYWESAGDAGDLPVAGNEIAAAASVPSISGSRIEEDRPTHPPSYTDLISKEPLFDVRDFAIEQADDGKPVATAGSLPASTLWDSELLRTKFQDLLSPPALFPPTAAAVVSAATEGTACAREHLFLADDGDVISLDPNAGFKQIDLSCFSIQAATIESNRILIDDGSGVAFEVRFQGISSARFASGVEVDLETLSIDVP